MYFHVCMSICMHIHTCIYIYIYLYIYIYTHTHTYEYIYIYGIWVYGICVYIYGRVIPADAPDPLTHEITHTYESTHKAHTIIGIWIAMHGVCTLVRPVCVNMIFHTLWHTAHMTPVAGSNLLPEKVSDSPNLFSEFFFPNSVLLCSFLWTVKWIHEGYHEGLR